jgi:glycosyltransferase involved in cell wall biosynthesis
MTIEIQICTIDAGIERVPEVLMDAVEDVCYTVSMQYTDMKYLALVPDCLRQRKDVQLVYLEGRGLSRNRNHALAYTRGDVVVIADDDNRYTIGQIDLIRQTYTEHPEADILYFEAAGMDGVPLQTNYPARVMLYREANARGVYAMSVGMTLRRTCNIRFDERFGLGSGKFIAGEEEVFMHHAQQQGCIVLFVPEMIVRTPAVTTGTHFAKDTRLQVAKGATFREVYGVREALWRSLKEGLWYMRKKSLLPFPIIYNMCKGIWN